jgi:energy-coupling factor transporter ATP-binding protein EcfA2
VSAIPPAPAPALALQRAPAAPTKPLRIKRLALTDFRAFPGPAPAYFDLDGKNLLVYGENGAGKSSIFHALSDFFSLKQNRDLRAYKNVFSGEPETNCSVEVEFNDGAPSAKWFMQAGTGAIGTMPLSSHVIGGAGPAHERHPATIGGGGDMRVTQAALRRAALDYRALLDTNYKQGDGAINLFDIAVKQLLTDFPVAVAGGTTRSIGELWRSVQQAKPAKHTKTALVGVNQACADFNSGFNQALAALHPLVGALLGDLIGADVTVAPFVFSGVTYTAAYYKRDREFAGRLLTLDVSYRTRPLPTPQHFLNEARLSALALAIYLAGRLASTPTATATALKLLVLDDVLIGLDHANRLPVLDVLKSRFADWQIVLLTHDRIWFEMVRFYLGAGDAWRCVEVFEALDTSRSIPSPQVRRTSANAAQAALNQAREFLGAHHLPAAANYTRAAFELTLKSFCERFKVPVVFRMDQRHLDTEALLSAIEHWWKAHAGKKAGIAGIVERVKLFRMVVLNPFSHASPPTISKAEIEGAIMAVEALQGVLEPCTDLSGDPLQAARTLLAAPPTTTEELHAALGYLRASFSLSLRRFCERNRVKLCLSNGPHATGTLWTAVLADRALLFSGTHTSVPAAIDAERKWIINPVSDSDLSSLTAADLARIDSAFATAAGPVLDGI